MTTEMILDPVTTASTAQDADIELTVRSKTVEAEGIVSYELTPTNDETLPGFAAGAHIQVHLDNGLTRQYSLCNPSASPSSYVIAVQRDPESRGGSSYIHESWNEGDRVKLSPPINQFGLVEGAPAVLLAAGIGITPILAMARELSEKRIPFTLHYATRSPEDAAFMAELESSEYADHVNVYFSRTGDPNRIDIAEIIGQLAPEEHLYVCGPPRLIEDLLEKATELGVPGDRVHREYFSGPTTIIEPTDSFELHLARSGQVLTMSPGTTVLEAVEDAGIEVPTSCEVGVCGTCVTPVIEGIPDHQDVFLTDEEHERNDCFTPCCSWSKTSKLVIDL
jgi:vanillate monooxygenase ferredoxin subunit